VLYLVAPGSVLIPWIGEVPAPLAVVGGALAITGVAIARDTTRPA
jgi:hypothetical protein